jgi:hypothetical protein
MAGMLTFPLLVVLALALVYATSPATRTWPARCAAWARWRPA